MENIPVQFGACKKRSKAYHVVSIFRAFRCAESGHLPVKTRHGPSVYSCIMQATVCVCMYIYTVYICIRLFYLICLVKKDV